MDDKVDYYLSELHKGDRENAFFCLIEMPPSIIPRLVQAYHSESDPAIRAILVEIIRQYRSPKTLRFLAEALRDNDGEVWKTALDGIAALGGPESIRILEAEKEGLLFGGQRNAGLRIEWIDEAIEQIANP